MTRLPQSSCSALTIQLVFGDVSWETPGSFGTSACWGRSSCFEFQAYNGLFCSTRWTLVWYLRPSWCRWGDSDGKLDTWHLGYNFNVVPLMTVPISMDSSVHYSWLYCFVSLSIVLLVLSMKTIKWNNRINKDSFFPQSNTSSQKLKWIHSGVLQNYLLFFHLSRCFDWSLEQSAYRSSERCLISSLLRAYCSSSLSTL